MIPQFNDLIFLLTGPTTVWLPESVNSALVILVLLLAAFFCPPRLRAVSRLSFLRPLETALNRLAQRRWLAIASVGIFAFALNAAISLWIQMPVPVIHDEFSYLLAADTFAHGRWTNAPSPFWVHFESFHIIQQPTYASKYPPGQGLMLAIGQILCGLPIAGSWLGTAFACMALCWALQQWLPARVAFLGGLLAVVHPIIVAWTQSYWGSQWAIAGGALALGALRFFQGKNKIPTCAAWVFGIGCGLMLITRPYEGAALSGLMLIYIGWQWRKSLINSATSERRKVRNSWLRAIATLSFLFASTVAFWGFYDFQVTGNALRMPYAVHEKTYGVSPLLLWQNFKPEPVYRHRVLRINHVFEEAPAYMRHRTPRVLLEITGEKLLRLWSSFSQSLALALGALLWPVVYRRDKWTRPLFVLLALLVCALLLEVWLLPHYTTPIVTLGLVLAMQGWRRWRVWRWHGRPAGLFLARAMVVLSFLSIISSVALLKRPDSDGLIFSTPGGRQFSRQRARLQAQLERTPGRDIVLVDYSLQHDNNHEWVYNAADIENAPIVWARAMTSAEDAALLRHFSARRVWRLDADARPPRLKEMLSR